jgi:hypothetical protein
MHSRPERRCVRFLMRAAVENVEVTNVDSSTELA